MPTPMVFPDAAFRKPRNASGQPSDSGDRLRINVLFTTLRETPFALKRAAELAVGLNAAILLIVPQIVPFPLYLNQPPVPLKFASDQLHVLVQSIDADVDVCIYLCRDRLQTFLRILR